MAGTLAPFQQGEDVLRRLAGLQVSASTCRRVTEAAGERLRQQGADGVVALPGRPAAWDFSLPDRDGQSFPGTVAYLGLDAFAVAARLRSYAIAFNLSAAAVPVALTDGGNGLERVLRQNVSGALQFVLDYWHEAERLHKFAGLLHAGDSGAAAAWAERAKGILWEGGGAAVLRHLQAIVLPPGAAS